MKINHYTMLALYLSHVRKKYQDDPKFTRVYRSTKHLNEEEFFQALSVHMTEFVHNEVYAWITSDVSVQWRYANEIGKTYSEVSDIMHSAIYAMLGIWEDYLKTNEVLTYALGADDGSDYRTSFASDRMSYQYNILYGGD